MYLETIVRHLAAMGTALTLTVSAPTRDHALQSSEAAVREIERVEALLSVVYSLAYGAHLLKKRPPATRRTSRAGVHSPVCFFCASAVTPVRPPRPIVSTALDGTITMDPFSLIAS